MLKKIIFLLFITGTTLAQTRQVYFDHYDVLSGLPDPNALVIKQDSRGFMWIGTQSGLVRFDGYRYQIYYLGNKDTNPHITTYINSILINGDDVWVSTIQNGLFKYDPYTDSFIGFQYPQKEIRMFYINKTDRNGNLWGYVTFSKTAPVLTKFDVGKKKFELFDHSFKGNLTAPVSTSSNNRVWILTDNGVYGYNEATNNFTGYFTNRDTSGQMKVTAFYEAPSQPGIYWMNVIPKGSTGSRLICWDSKTNAKPSYKSYPVRSVLTAYEDKKKQLWFTTDTGLLNFNRRTGKFLLFAQPKSVSQGRPNLMDAIREDGTGMFWMNTSTGLVVFDPQSKRFESTTLYKKMPNELLSSTVQAMFVDHTGLPWIGTQWHGAFRVNPIKSAFTVYKNADLKTAGYNGTELQFVSKNDTASLLRDDQGIYEGLPGSGRFKKVYTLPEKQNFQGVICGTDGLWYMATSAGLRVYNPVKKTSKLFSFNSKDPGSLPINDISIIYQQKGSLILWIGTVGEGLCSFDMRTKKITRYPYRKIQEYTTPQNNNTLDGRSVQAICEDSDGIMWLGTDEGGLNRFDPKTGRFFSYYTRQNRGITCVMTVRTDHAGRLWVCTYQNGVFLFDRHSGKVIRHFDSSNGLLFNDAMTITEDKTGNMWVLSPRGLSKIDGQTLTITKLRVGDILPGYEITNAGLGQVTCMEGLGLLPGGNILIPLKTGIAVLRPEQLKRSPYPPVVHIEQVELANPLAPEGKGEKIIPRPLQVLRAAHNENRVTFNYVALHYDDPANNAYAYQLEGYDKTWVQAGHTRWATYTNLSPGSYIFHVKAANSSGVWNNKGDSVILIIASPWWITWWAWVLYIIIAGVLIYAYVSFRSRYLRQQNRLLEEKVTLRTTQLNAANHELSEQQEEITAQRDELSVAFAELQSTQTQLIQSEKMASLGELTAGIAHEIQNPLNFVNNFSEVSVELLQELKEEAQSGHTPEVIALADDLAENLSKINHHGKRADRIVKGMLEHSRTSSAQKTPTDLNKLADEYLRLAYHGLRAKDKSFNAELITNFDESLPPANVIPQDMGRVLLNLFNNAFYAVQQQKATAGIDYKPTVEVGTFKSSSGGWGIRVKDNGIGVPDTIKDKIMQPFFTTKPTGEGTGLGLSLSYDIVVKGHGGKIDINSTKGTGAVFVITLPLIL